MTEEPERPSDEYAELYAAYTTDELIGVVEGRDREIGELQELIVNWRPLVAKANQERRASELAYSRLAEVEGALRKIAQVAGDA